MSNLRGILERMSSFSDTASDLVASISSELDADRISALEHMVLELRTTVAALAKEVPALSEAGRDALVEQFGAAIRNTSVQSLVLQFNQQYFRVYDQDTRTVLAKVLLRHFSEVAPNRQPPEIWSKLVASKGVM